MKYTVKTLSVLIAASLAGANAMLAAAAPTTNATPAATNTVPASTNTTPAPNAATNAASPKMDDLFPDPVIAKGKGFEVKRTQLDEAVSGAKARAEAMRQQLTAADMPFIEKSSFDRILQVKMLNLKANEAEKAKGLAEAGKRWEIIHKRAPNEEMLNSQLRAMNLTIPELKKRLAEEATAEQVLLDKVTVSDAEIKKFYDENPSRFEEPEMVDASHILITTQDPSGQPLSDDQKKAKRKIIDALLVRARNGEDFAKLAKENSDDPGSKENGGQYKFHKGQMVPEFESAAFSLKTNQVSDVVTTQYGYHIIKLNQKIPAKKLDFGEVKDQIKNYMQSTEVQKILPDFYAQLKKEYDVQILDTQLKKLEETDASLPPRGSGITPPSSVPAPSK